MKPEIFLRKAAFIAGTHIGNKRYPLACVAKRADGTIIWSVNHDTVGKSYSHHAEARALRKCDKGATLYIARVQRADCTKWLLAKPCLNCQKLIKQHRVKEVYYTITTNEYGYWRI